MEMVNIKEQRERLGISQEELARLAEVSRATVARAEAGAGSIKASTLAALRDALGASPESGPGEYRESLYRHAQQPTASELDWLEAVTMIPTPSGKGLDPQTLATMLHLVRRL